MASTAPKPAGDQRGVGYRGSTRGDGPARLLSVALDRLQWMLTRTGPRLSNLTLTLLGGIGMLAVIVVLGVELQGSDYGRKVAAALAMEHDTARIRAAREARELPVHADVDPNATGLIGTYTSPITTDRGSLRQKLTATNPAMAAAVTDLLDQARVGRGDVVAIGMTGSFPGMNLAVLEALEQRGATVLEIVSIGSSNWGANEPEFTWLDMQQILIEADRLHPQVLGASLGGGDDNGRTMTRQGPEQATEAIRRNGVELIMAESISGAVAERLRRYREAAAGRPIRLYINIGGGVASVGPETQRQHLRSGVNRQLPRGAERNSGVAYEFLRQGTPVLHLRDMRAVAQRYGLPDVPQEFAAIGTEPVYRDRGLQTMTAAVALVALGLAVILARLGYIERLWYRLGWLRPGA